jgi:hypothetical protein
MAEHESSGEIHNISVEKLDDDRFRVLFGAKTDIPGLYSASEGIELDRDLLEQFIKSACEALED